MVWATHDEQDTTRENQLSFTMYGSHGGHFNLRVACWVCTLITNKQDPTKDKQECEDVYNKKSTESPHSGSSSSLFDSDHLAAWGIPTSAIIVILICLAYIIYKKYFNKQLRDQRKRARAGTRSIELSSRHSTTKTQELQEPNFSGFSARPRIDSNSNSPPNRSELTLAQIGSSSAASNSSTNSNLVLDVMAKMEWKEVKT